MLLSKLNEEVTIKKPNGEETKTQAMISGDTIFIAAIDFPVEEGDEVIRKLPNGQEEKFVIEDRNFMRAIGSFPDHYQLKVKKPNKISNNINVIGSNARLNINSNDNSINLSAETVNISNVFNGLEIAISKKIDNKKEMQELLSSVKEMKTADKSTFFEKYKNFIAMAANHMDIIAPFIPALTELLTKS